MLKRHLVRLLYRFFMRNRAHDASLKHPQFPRLIALVRDRRWSEFRSAFEQLPTDERHVLLSGIAESSTFADEFASWAEEDSSTGALVHGTALLTHAWRARTALAGKYVTPQAAKEFFQHLNDSYEHLMAAHATQPSDPEPLARLVRVLMGLQVNRDQIYECHEILLETGRHHLVGEYHTVEALAPKWDGDQQELLAFARTRANADPRNWSLIAYAHIENWVSTRMSDAEVADSYFERPDVKQEIIEAHAADPARSGRDYFSLLARNVYAVCFFQMADKPRTHHELTAIGDRYSSKPWVYVNGVERDAINSVRQWAQLPELQ